MSSSLIKAGYVNSADLAKDNRRVIDSNQAVSDRLKLLSEILETSYADSDFTDGFSAGLNAEQVDALFQDGEEEYSLEGEYSDEVYQEENVHPEINQEEYLAEINAEAERLISEANNNADNILASANQEAEEIKARAYEEGRASGEEAGYNDGLSRVQELEKELNDKIAQVQIDYEEMVSQLEPRFVEVLTDIYSHVFNVDLSDRTELILHLLKNTIRNIDGSMSFFIHVSPNNYDEVVAAREDLSAGLASTCTVEVIEDMTLSIGECFIEAESGIFDCSLGTELEALKKELRLLSYK